MPTRKMVNKYYTKDFLENKILQIKDEIKYLRKQKRRGANVIVKNGDRVLVSSALDAAKLSLKYWQVITEGQTKIEFENERS